MGTTKVLGCRKDKGELVCDFRDKNDIIIVRGSVNEKGEGVITDSHSTSKDGADPNSMIEAEKYTLQQIRLKKRSEGEF